MSIIFNDESHSGKVLLKLWKQREDEDSCDTVLIAGTEKRRIPAHCTILSVESEYFNKILTAAKRTNMSLEVKIPNVNGEILQRLIGYIYTGSIVISEDSAVELLKAAHMLHLFNVVTACENYLVEQLNPSNCFGFEVLAKRYHCVELLQKSRNYNFKQMLKMYETEEFLSLSAEQMSQLLGRDDLCVPTEQVAFNLLKEWIEYNKTEREVYKVELLKLVRLSLLEKSFLMQDVKPFCPSVECLQMYTEALERHLTTDNNQLIGSKLIKPRRSNRILVGMTQNKIDKKTCIHYYCREQQKWMKWSKELEYRTVHGVAVMEHDLFFIGGWNGNSKFKALNTVICLNLKTMSLKEITPMTEHRAYCAAAVLNGFLYAMGGWNGKIYMDSVEKWDPKTNKWTVVASMAVARSNFGVAVLNQKLYVVGGSSNRNDLSSVECYDPVQNIWNTVAAMHESHIFPEVSNRHLF